MPPNLAPHLTDWLLEIGLTEPGGMGGPISWQTVDAWRRSTSVPIEPWVARLLKRLSAAYHAEAHRAEAEACPPPWRTAISAREREADEEALRRVLD